MNFMVRARSLHPLTLDLSALIGIFATSIVLNMIYRHLNFDTSQVLIPVNLVKYPIWVLGVAGVIVAPLIETFVFQYGVKKILNKFGLGGFFVYIPISAFLFGISHGVGLSFTPAFISGFILAFVFQVRDFPNGHPFPNTCLIHFFKNAIAFWGTVSL